jgi:hypothetical protein
MYYLRNLAVIALLVSCWFVCRMGRSAPPQLSDSICYGMALKTYVITYRVDKDGVRGKEQKTTVTASSSSDAKDDFRTSNPDAVIISCTEKTK